MCGIVGYVGPRESVPILIEGLRKLEYRGYDSAGVAVHEKGETRVVRCQGKLANLEKQLALTKLTGSVGIGHTRWATHGRPSETNAHPHRVGGVSVVHNGIIEKHMILRQRLMATGRKFSSETDTEIVAHLVDAELKAGVKDLGDAVRNALKQVEGAYALVVLSDSHPDRLVCAKVASPMVLGVGEGENFVASDIPAILSHTRNMIFLEDGQVAELTAQRVTITDLAGRPMSPPVKTVVWNSTQAEKNGFKHFMLKEIHEQPRAVTDTLRGRLELEQHDALLDEVQLDPATIKKIIIVACGTSNHAGMVGKFMIEQLARIPVECDLASEFRYRDPIVGPGDLVIAVSQSGETADTLAAVKEAKAKGARILSIANVVDSSIPRASDGALYTHAGPEIGVASTKAFTTQLIALALIALHLGRKNGKLSKDAAKAFIDELLQLPTKMKDVADQAAPLQVLARRYGNARDFLFLGRGINHPIALEGALKLKEISYIHAEGYSAGEMKHGPIALIDEHMPVVVIAPKGPGYEKVMSNLTEVKAREGKIIAIASRGDQEIGSIADEVILIPECASVLSPLLTVVPLQLLAYYVADFKGTDVDQPRNLAKSVTVE